MHLVSDDGLDEVRVGGEERKGEGGRSEEKKTERTIEKERGRVMC